MRECTTFVGLDAHKKSISVAVMREGAELREWELENTPKQVHKLAKKLVEQAPGEVRVCYEAGPLGYSLMRQLEQVAGLVCEVIAPSLIPVKPGERIKTDRRDARKLAMLYKAGLLTVVQAPTSEDESLRDLVRCRQDVVENEKRARHRLQKFLLRRALVYRGNSRTQAFEDWLRAQHFAQKADQVVFEEYRLELAHTTERRRALEQTLDELAATDAYRERVGWLRCFHGIETVTAMTILAELHDIRRFENPRQLFSYLGLVPSEHSSGETTKKGAITKTGNRFLRTILVEAAWHYRHAPGAGHRLRRRREGQPAWAVSHAQKAHRRLNRRYRRLTERGKPANKAIVAVARELIGFVWAVLHPDSRTRTAMS
ncbi:MAG: IS110 family transposase [Myxococcales bacterium]|nr:IS110 family transposase [Myxococcales bacterium]